MMIVELKLINYKPIFFGSSSILKRKNKLLTYFFFR